MVDLARRVGNRRGRFTSLLGGDVLAYFNTLVARPDHHVSYSLRNTAQVAALRSSPDDDPISVSYDYANDPDPRKQDACKLHVHDVALGFTGLTQNLTMTIPVHYPDNLLLTYDEWMGAEWDYPISDLPYHKGFPYIFSHGEGDAPWCANRRQHALAHVHEETLPAGGPYISMYSPQAGSTTAGCFFKDPFHRGGAAGYAVEKLPYGAPSAQQRTYIESIAPRATDVTAAGMEFGTVAERWHRIWWFWERAAGEDWEVTYQSAPVTVKAYKLSIWVADTVREPVLITNEAIGSISPEQDGGYSKVQWHIALGDSFSYPPGRPDLIAYVRNLVALRGISKADVLTLLQKPVVS